MAQYRKGQISYEQLLTKVLEERIRKEFAQGKPKKVWLDRQLLKDPQLFGAKIPFQVSIFNWNFRYDFQVSMQVIPDLRSRPFTLELFISVLGPSPDTDIHSSKLGWMKTLYQILRVDKSYMGVRRTSDSDSDNDSDSDSDSDQNHLEPVSEKEIVLALQSFFRAQPLMPYPLSRLEQENLRTFLQE